MCPGTLYLSTSIVNNAVDKHSYSKSMWITMWKAVGNKKAASFKFWRLGLVCLTYLCLLPRDLLSLFLLAE